MLEATHYEIKVRRHPWTEEEKQQQLERYRTLGVEDISRDYFNIWAPESMPRVVQQPVGINEIQTRTNGERVIEIDTSRMEP